MGVYHFLKGIKGWQLKQEKSRESNELILRDAEVLLKVLPIQENEVEIKMETLPFRKAGLLELVRIGTASPGGGYYRWFNRKGKLIQAELWLCDLPLLLFGDIPDKIFLRIIHTV
jgi:uncharacterized protein DUF6717